MPEASQCDPGAVAGVKDAEDALAEVLNHLGTLGLAAVGQILVEQSVQQAVVKHALSDDRFDALVHKLEECFLLFRVLLQGSVQSRHVRLLKQLELGTVKLLCQQSPLRRVRPVVVGRLQNFGSQLQST